MKILIIEDDKTVGQLLKRFLSKIASEPGDEIEIVTSMEEARRAILKIPAPDLVTLDLLLPDSAEPEKTLSVIDEIHQHNPNAVVLVFSGVMEDMQEASNLHHADAYLRKQDGMRYDVLMKAVQTAFQSKMTYDRRLDILERLTRVIQPIKPRTA